MAVGGALGDALAAFAKSFDAGDLAGAARQLDILDDLDPKILANATKNLDPGKLGDILNQLSPEKLASITKKIDPSVLSKLDPAILNKLPADTLGQVAVDNVDIIAKNAESFTPPDNLVNGLKKMPEASQKTFMKAFKEVATSPAALNIYAAAVAAGVAGGVLTALDKEAAEQQKCLTYCLPSNWDATPYGGFGGKETIKYSTLESIKTANGGKAFPKAPGKLKWDSTFPLCAPPIDKECSTFCKSKCDKAITSGVPGASGLQDKIVSTLQSIIPDFPTPSEETMKILTYVGWGLLALFLLLFLIWVGKLATRKKNT